MGVKGGKYVFGRILRKDGAEIKSVAYIYELPANKMTPKVQKAYYDTIQSLLLEIEEILADQALIGDFKTLALRKNIFRSKCLFFLSMSFENPENEFKKEFEENFTQVSQIKLTQLNNVLPVSFEIDQFEYAKSLLLKFKEVTNFVNSFMAHLPTETNDEGIFFKGQYFDAIFQLNNLVTQTNSEIKLIDNYIDIHLLNYLRFANQNVSFKILTSSHDINKLKLALGAFNQDYKNFEVRESNSYHDRFMIVDDFSFYHFGASLKDIGKKTFMFSKIGQPSIQLALQNDFNNVWNISKKLYP